MGLEPKHKHKAPITDNGATLTARPRRIKTRPRRARIVEGIALGPQTRRRVPFIRLGLVKELLLASNPRNFATNSVVTPPFLSVN